MAFHWEGLLPRVNYRQWTLSLPRVLRFAVVKKRELFTLVQRRLVKAICRWQNKEARRLGWSEKTKTGAVAFIQLFGSALQLTPHIHLLVAEAVWTKSGQRVPLPPPEPADVERVLRRILKQLAKDFADRDLPEYAEDGLSALQQEGVQQRLPFSSEELAVPPRKAARLSVLEGFSLHADTHIHGNDRQGLRQLIRYGARGPLSLKRLTELPDGTLCYETKKAGKVVHLTPEKLVKRLAALVPPKEG